MAETPRRAPNSKLLDLVLAAVLLGGSFLVYLNTLAPSVATIFDDSLEFQLVCYQPGIAHPSGYPLYTLLGKLFTFLPVGDVAYRVNLMSAVFGALAVALTYATLRLLAKHRVPALLGAATFAVSPVFWSQAVIAEVYTLNAAFAAATLSLLLAWAQASERQPAAENGRWQNPTTLLSLLALVYGLSLTHHRTMLLLAPAALLFVITVDRSLFTRGRLLAKLALLLVAPLLLYLYLPWRGMTMSSLNGVYQNTLGGFLSYVAAGSYGIFLTDNPLAQSHDLAFYATLLRDQFTWVGIALAAAGLVYSLRKWREALLLLLYALTTILFAFGYHVPDIEVFLIPLFLVCALWIGMGFGALWKLALALVRRFIERESSGLQTVLYACLLVGGALLPLSLWQHNHAQVDLSQRWEVHDYGVDVLSLPLEEDAVIVGILGEITLLNYFQQTEGLLPDLATIPADTEEERLAVVEDQMRQGHPVYLTRPLASVEEEYHLASLGPLVRVMHRPVTLHEEAEQPLSLPFGEAIILSGCETEIRDTHVGPVLRLSLYWKTLAEIEKDYKLSIRLLDAAGHLGGVRDAFPVQEAYRTNNWRPGEMVVDTHDVSILAGLPPGPYTIQVTMYDPETLAPLATQAIGSLTLGQTLGLDRAGLWDVQHRSLANLGGRVRLLGYSVVGETFKPGDSIPLTFLWQGLSGLNGSYSLLLWLDDETGSRLGQTEVALSGSYPPPGWQEGEVVRDWQSFLVPGNTPDGSYRLRMEVRRDRQPLSRLLWRLPLGATLDLGQIQIQGRERVFETPSIGHALDLRLGESVRLLGYDLAPTEAHPGETLRLTLYWECLGPMSTSYTVFVHLLDEDANIRGQRDSVPGGGALPTTSWAEGEIITDSHEITFAADAPSGSYTIVAGLYDAATGTRLPASGADGSHLGDHFTVTQVSVSTP
jgi:hypothetical protein